MDQGKAAGRIAWIALGLIFLCVGGLLGAFGALYVLFVTQSLLLEYHQI